MKDLNVFFGKRTDLLTLLCHFTISFYIRSLIRRVQTKSPSSKKPWWICSWNTTMALLTMLFCTMWCFTCGQSKSSGGTGGTRTLVLSEEPRIELCKGFLSSAEITAIRKLAEEEMFKDHPWAFFFPFLTKWYLLVAAILLESCEGLWNTGHDGVFLTSTPKGWFRKSLVLLGGLGGSWNWKQLFDGSDWRWRDFHLEHLRPWHWHRRCSGVGCLARCHWQK